MKIIKIGAMWCPACIIMNKYWNKIEEDFSNIEFVKYDLDLDEEVVEKYNVGNILPVIIAMDNDKEIERIIGEKKEEEIREFIKKVGSTK